MRCRGLWLLLFVSTFAYANSAKTSSAAHHSLLPVTTHSAQARKSFEQAMDNFEQYRLSVALQNLRAATKSDPQFAQAYILIARISRDPQEVNAAREHAVQYVAKATSAEQLLVKWISNAQEGDYIPAIAAMNDLLSQYPDDQRLAFLAGDWLNGQRRWEQSIVVLEHALKLNPEYPAALNDVGYAYAYTGDFQKAFAAMDRYVALQPDEPNPRDSYGELLRMAGKFEQALEQYRASIRIDPNFGSEQGVADTYALMGREEDARAEYERAEVFAGSNYDKIEFELRSAVTWIRENDHKQTEKSLAEVAHHAHSAGIAYLEAEAHRELGMFDSEAKAAMKHFDEANAALADNREISQSDRENEQATILKARAERAAEAQDFKVAAESVQKLQAMADASRSVIVQVGYHGANGALLEAQRKHGEAIPELEEDSDDPVSMRLLWAAYNASGDMTQAHAMAAKLAAFNFPTEEQALVVPQFRAEMLSKASQQ
jgi:tetratricopeptide (TPR) repeat protein